MANGIQSPVFTFFRMKVVQKKKTLLFQVIEYLCSMLFSEVIGQQPIKERLIQSVRDNRISHALLFAGHPGNGSLALALAFVQYINCENRLPADSCGTCSSCVKMRKLIHPDVHFSYPVAGPNKPKSIDFIASWREALLSNFYLEVQEWYEYLSIENKQGFISVDEAGDILRKLSLKAFESEYKTILMWLPEKMRTEASNALLKILEEPPDKTLFLLITENAEQLLPTILSRTQLIRTNRLSDEEIAGALTGRMGLSNVESLLVARQCDGNFNASQKLAGKEEAGINNEKDFVDWMRACFNPNKFYPVLLERMERFSRLSREGQKDFLNFSLTIIRECLLMNLGVQPLLRFGEQGYEELIRFSSLVHTGNVHLFEQELNKAYFHTERNANAKILFLNLSFKLNKVLMISSPAAGKMAAKEQQ